MADGEVDIRLIEEYRANVELWKHDDTLRQHRTANFLTVNTVLLAVAALALSVEPADSVAMAIVAVFSLFGAGAAIAWYAVHRRNAEYIRLRRLLLIDVERKLGAMTAFTRTYQAMYRGAAIEFGPETGTFRVQPGSRFSSTKVENVLPLLTLAFWLIACATLELTIALG